MTTKKVIMYSVIGFIITALVLGGTVFYITSKNKQEKPKEIKTYTHSMGEIYANVQDSRRILKINMDVEISDEKLVEKFKEKNSKIKNGVLEILGKKSEEDLLVVGGQEALRKEILKEIKKIVPSSEILDVFFVEFIVQ
ncbi:MAG: flagellar basal body-associated FliL family protein [Anaeromicrobium sp.]|jgi:flagellar FliL protein|uniref:flagellar basal body-associated FliL family protein n=1 Tax=Anaeromicrobium sp. TaxID=1929132 RepID=UPI0025D5D99C|nr:flagellar basal body-associated FliL family protein [Anaeromicrobium sp.]MCT4595589.1 flagellar basal body-associated FliL family protein [Anaeromicrobium sp.]